MAVLMNITASETSALSSVAETTFSEAATPKAVTVMFPRVTEEKSATQFDQPKIYGFVSHAAADAAPAQVASGTPDITLKISDVALGDLVSKYEGTVLRRDAKTIWVRLQDSSRSIPAIEVEFDLNDLPVSERALAVEGAPMIWTLGYTEGTRRKQSILYVRRVPSATPAEISESMKRLRSTVGDIKWD